MKKILFLIVIFVIALGAGCKKKVEPTPPPPPPPVEKISLQDFMKEKGFSSMISNLEPGQVVTVKIDPNTVLFDETELYVSKFPLEFRVEEDWESIVKYATTFRFPSIVLYLKSKYMGEKDSQLEIRSLSDYSYLREQGELIWFLKESPKGTPPFENIPTALVEYPSGKFLVLNQESEEMPKWNSNKN